MGTGFHWDSDGKSHGCECPWPSTRPMSWIRINLPLTTTDPSWDGMSFFGISMGYHTSVDWFCGGKSTKKNHMVLTIEVGWGFRSRLSGHPILRVRLKVDTLNPASPPSIFVIQNGDHGISHHCHPTCPHVSHLKLPDVLTYSPK